jgi:hypothetical protein
LSQVENENFGILIAYLIPGFLVLSGLAPHSPAIQTWLGSTSKAPTVGGFLFATVASVGAGLLTSTVRWLVLDHIHARTGLRPPALDFAKLQANIDAFQAVVEYHYRYYQAYGNTMVAILVVAIGRWPFSGVRSVTGLLAIVALMLLCFVASRDALRKYYVRLTALYSNAPDTKETSDDQRCPPSENEQQGIDLSPNPEEGQSVDAVLGEDESNRPG